MSLSVNLSISPRLPAIWVYYTAWTAIIKTDWASWTIDIYFLTILVAKSPRSQCQHDWFLVRTLFLACGSYLLLCAQVVSSLWEGEGEGVLTLLSLIKALVSSDQDILPPTMSSSEPNSKPPKGFTFKHHTEG